MVSKSTKSSTSAAKSGSKKTSARSGQKKGNSSAKKPSSVRNSSSAAKTASGRKSASSAKKQPEQLSMEDYEYTDPLIYYEIFLWLVLAFSILLFISYLGFGGVVGQAVSSFFFGCFGAMAYLFPFLLFFMTAFLISNRSSHIAKIKAVAAFAFYLVTCGLLELMMLGYTRGFALMEYYEAGARYKNGGGLIGGLFVNLFCPAIGVAGAYIMMIIMIIICVVLITQRSLFAGMKHQGTRVYRSAKEEQLRRRDQEPAYFTVLPKDTSARLPEENFAGSPSSRLSAPSVLLREPKLDKESRMANRVSGVTSDTSLLRQAAALSDEIRQVLPKKTEQNLDIPVLDFTIQRADGSGKSVKTEGEQENTYFQTLKMEEKQEAAIPPEKKERKTESPFMPESFTERSMEAEQENFVAQEKEAISVPLSTTQEEEVSPDQTVQEEEKPVRRARKPHASQEEINEGIENVEQEIAENSAAVKPQYIFPPVSLLKKPSGKRGGSTDGELRETAQKLQQILHTFGVNVKVTNVSCGPSVTRYELMPEMGVKVSKIVNLTDDIKLNLAAADIRIEAPIPGKAAVGIEVPNKEASGVLLRELLESEEFKNHPSNLAYAVGKDIAGKIIVSDIAKMPHLLIAGATGSGKSVFINTLIMSIIYKAKPEDVKMIMIDPKVVELSVYNGIPHLFIPVVTDPKKAAGALNWGVAEMTTRYQKFAELGVRDLKGYNAKIESIKDIEDENKPEKLPQIVIIVDELADLMMVASGEVEDAICRLAQLARAAGIHLVIATQRPSVDVITGLIKANMPSRIAFSVSSGVDSRTILDMNGAEKLLGNGDMLFAPQTYKKPARVQGAFVSDSEVSAVVDFLKDKNMTAQYSAQMEAQIEQVQKSALMSGGGSSDVDELFADAGKFVIEKDKASSGMLQRWFKIGFNRAARIMDQLYDAGVVGPEEGTKPRKVLMSMEQFENYLEEN